MIFRPLDVPAWLQYLMDHRWAYPFHTPEALVARGFPAFAVVPHHLCDYDRFLWAGELPDNALAVLFEVAHNIERQQAEALQHVLAEIGVQLPTPPREEVH